MTFKNLKKRNADKIIKLSYLIFLERTANSEELEYYNKLLNNGGYNSVKKAITSSDEYAIQREKLFLKKTVVKKNKSEPIDVGSEEISILTPRSRQIYKDLICAISVL